MNKLDIDYQNLLQDILNNGVKKSNRTGVETLSVFGRQLRHSMSTGFPLLTTKKLYWKGIIAELLWFLKGDTNIKYLLENNCHIWNGDAYKSYIVYMISGVNTGLDKISGYFNPDWFIEDGNEYKHFKNPSFVGFRPLTMVEFVNKILTDDNFAKRWGDMGPIYGEQWRSWPSNNPVLYDGMTPIIGWKVYYENDIFKTDRENIDQISKLINDLKTDPDSRRLQVNAWNVAEIEQMKLPPCHYGFQCWTRNLTREERIKIYSTEFVSGNSVKDDHWMDAKLSTRNIPQRYLSLMFNIRSNDLPLGLPFNIASYGLLLVILSKMVNMVPDELIVNIGDAHIYVNQIDGVKEQLTRTPYELPQLTISDTVNFNGTIDDMLNSCKIDDFKIENYKSHPTIKIPLSN